VHVLPHDELKCADEGGFHGRDVDLSISLSGMPVTDFEKRALGVNWNLQGCARDQFSIVEIACMNPGRTTTDSSGYVRRRNAHAAEKWF